jgi:hypothetical protein
VELEQQLCEVLCAIEEQQELGAEQHQHQQHHDFFECKVLVKQQSADGSSVHCGVSNSSCNVNLHNQQQQHYSNCTSKLNFGSYSTEPLYRDEPGFSSDGGAASVSVQLSPAAAAAAAVSPAQKAVVQPVAPCEVEVMIYQNLLAARDSAAGTTAGDSAASSANGAAAAQKPLAAAVFGQQSSGFYKTSAGLYTPGGSLIGSTVSATAALALALQQLQLQQVKQQPWYMRTGIRHGASIPTSSAGGFIPPSAASVVLGSANEQQQQQQQQQGCCQCCHVCGAQQLPQQQQQQQQQRLTRASAAGRLSLFGQGLAAYLSRGNSISARGGADHISTTSSRSSNQGMHHSTTSAQIKRKKNTKLHSQPSLDMPRGAANWQLESQPERSSMSLSSLGAEAWQALRQRSIALLSLTGSSSSSNSSRTKASEDPASATQEEESQQQYHEADMNAAAAGASGSFLVSAAPAAAGQMTAELASSVSPKQQVQRLQVAPGSSKRLKLQPVLPVIQSEPCTPRAAVVAAEGAVPLPSSPMGTAPAAAAAAATATEDAASTVLLPGSRMSTVATAAAAATAAEGAVLLPGRRMGTVAAAAAEGAVLPPGDHCNLP